MSNVITLKTNYAGRPGPMLSEKDAEAADRSWLRGYLAGLMDASRSGADVQEVFQDSGLSYQEFARAGADEYDLERLKEILK